MLASVGREVMLLDAWTSSVLRSFAVASEVVANILQGIQMLEYSLSVQDQVNGSMMSLDASSSPGHISHLAVAGVGLWVASYGASTVALYHTESFIHMQVGGAHSHPWCQTD